MALMRELILNFNYRMDKYIEAQQIQIDLKLMELELEHATFYFIHKFY